MKTSFANFWRNMYSVVLLISLIFIAGCSSSKGVIDFTPLKYPTSMSAFLFDQNQNLVMKGKELDTLFKFNYKKTFWTLAYGSIQLTKDDGITDYLNSIVDKYKGDGIINLTVTIEHGAVNKLYSFLLYLPSLIPIFPGSALITVSGEVVKLKHSESTGMVGNMDSYNFISKENIKSKVYETLHAKAN
jgi:hypothetical protein